MASLDRVYERGENPVLEEVTRHIKTMVGPVAAVVPDPAPADLAIDVVMVEPTPARPYRTLVTSGMSARPGAVPIGWGNCRYTELALARPRDWRGAAGPGAGGWPVELLRSLARLPHASSRWLWLGHTVMNGTPPRPYAPDTQLCGVALRPLRVLGRDVARVRRADGDSTWVLGVVPLFAEELRLSPERLAVALDDARVTELLDPARGNIAVAQARPVPDPDEPVAGPEPARVHPLRPAQPQPVIQPQPPQPVAEPPQPAAQPQPPRPAAQPEPPRATPVQPVAHPPRPAAPRPERPGFQPRPATPPPSYQPRPAPPGGGRKRRFGLF